MHTQRQNILRNALRKKSISAYFILSGSNIFYLTGITSFLGEHRDGFLLITQKNTFIFTDKLYSEPLKKIKSLFVIEISSRQDIYIQIQNILEKENAQQLGFESQNIFLYEYLQLKKYLKEIKLLPLAGVIEKMRRQKSEDEIKHIVAACKLTDKTFSHILPYLKTGVSELEIQAEMEYFMKKNNGAPAFETIVAFGKNSAVPHHQASVKKLKKSDSFILLDFGARVNNYCADMTRTVFISKPTPKQKKMYETVLNAQEKVLQILFNSQQSIINNQSVNVSFSNLHTVADKTLQDNGFPSMPHSLGHGIGIDVHEAPHLSFNSQESLLPNTVFSVEPGMYLANQGGVRIEDTVVYTKNSFQVLTRSSKQIIELS